MNGKCREWCSLGLRAWYGTKNSEGGSPLAPRRLRIRRHGEGWACCCLRWASSLGCWPARPVPHEALLESPRAELLNRKSPTTVPEGAELVHRDDLHWSPGETPWKICTTGPRTAGSGALEARTAHWN